MYSPGVDPKLQKIIRDYFPDKSQWKFLAEDLETTIKNTQYNLNPLLGRDVTYHFIGLLSVHMPDDWSCIMDKYSLVFF